ncbi:hypothetical protein LRY29_00640 [Candidatus Saccharibacteria bacterium]|nr:hypothetical protein [Candidatus Saccharibacteria bacterium]
MRIANSTQRIGYYHVSIRDSLREHLLDTNDERARIVALLQDALGIQSFLDDPIAYQKFGARIDLLAFSITRHSIELVIFALNKASGRLLARLLSAALQELSNHHPTTTIHTLSGSHHALLTSIRLHARHDDWEYDRYSSIGFYLHDRRGDWVRLRRVSALFSADPERYRALFLACQPYVTRSNRATSLRA